ncbi:MAG: bifunctional demethylmenaquinone methyltransferase/2-methoxy-6-polyprenyl-1,4-benzoquinol methylase UbiE [Rikenellaceae bacterium]
MNNTIDSTTKPYSEQENKKSQVRRMFNNIAPNYDFLNRVLSFGIDIHWRKVLVKALKKQVLSSGASAFEILDLATGTADLPIMISRKLKKQMPNITIKGVDLSPQMLSYGQIKLDKLASKEPLAKNITLEEGDAEQLRFSAESFDAVTAVFGVRNFGDLEKGVSQIFRVTKNKGQIYILEFGMPENKIIGSLYRLYFLKMLPAIGGLISKDFKAYDYLPKSVETFASKHVFCKILSEVGFSDVKVKSMTFGVANIYYGTKNM